MIVDQDESRAIEERMDQLSENLSKMEKKIVSLKKNPYPLLSMRIDDLGVNTRTRNALINADIHYLGQLLSLDWGSVSKIYNIGWVSCVEIDNALKKWGLYLKMDIGDWSPPENNNIANNREERDMQP